MEHPENNEKPLDKCKVKFKIVSLKVKGPVEYVPELVNPLSDSISPAKLNLVFNLNVSNLHLLVGHHHFNGCLLLQFDEQKDQVAVEQILRVVFLDAERPSPVSLSKTSFSFDFLIMQYNY